MCAKFILNLRTINNKEVVAFIFNLRRLIIANNKEVVAKLALVNILHNQRKYLKNVYISKTNV